MSNCISRRICCTCLSEDRKLFLLSKMPDGLNLLYLLLTCDSEAYKEGFFKDAVSWLICWECCAIFKKIQKFRYQTCTAIKQLKDIEEGKQNKMKIKTLSELTIIINPSNNETNFVDCGLELNQIKKESIDLFDDHIYDETNFIGKDEKLTETIDNKKENEPISNPTYNCEKLIKKISVIQEKTKNGKKEFFIVTEMDDEELKKVNDSKRLDMKSDFKCDSCVLEFTNEIELHTHHLEFHTKKENHTPCSICLSYIKDDLLDGHIKNHYIIYKCKLCDYRIYTEKQMLKHMKEIHKKFERKKKLLKKVVKSNGTTKYPCTECDMIFPNKGAKWKHVQKVHRIGYKCESCEKVFSFKHNLQRHQLNHTGPHPHSECPHCHKQIRTSQMSVHIRTHSARASVVCVPCGKTFVCRATYETHLKYASVHAVVDVLRYACSQCDKKYRSRGELNDHVAYVHEDKARHKCPVCNKLLATRRCVTRHVKRAHEGIKENVRDKMCHYCGKAFRDKKSLEEHVSRHTGDRPHECGHCGRTFRQKAALYVHSRRLHAE